MRSKLVPGTSTIESYRVLIVYTFCRFNRKARCRPGPAPLAPRWGGPAYVGPDRHFGSKRPGILLPQMGYKCDRDHRPKGPAIFSAIVNAVSAGDARPNHSSVHSKQVAQPGTSPLRCSSRSTIPTPGRTGCAVNALSRRIAMVGSRSRQIRRVHNPRRAAAPSVWWFRFNRERTRHALVGEPIHAWTSPISQTPVIREMLMRANRAARSHQLDARSWNGLCTLCGRG